MSTFYIATMCVSGACSRSEESGSQAAQLTNISANVRLTTVVDASYAGGSELWAASFPRGALNPAGALVSFNSNESYNGHLIGVSVTTSNGISWTRHNSDDANYFPFVTMTSGQSSRHCTLPDGGTANCSWLSDSSAAGTGIDHQVVIGSIVKGDDSTQDVAVALSTNDGGRFTRGLVLSDATSGGGTGGGGVDAPVIASSGNGVLWAWWSGWLSGQPFPGPSFIRRFTTTGGKLDAPNPPINISSRLMVADPVQATIAAQFNPLNGMETIELVYSDFPMGAQWSCPSTQPTADVTWWLSVSPDSGATWTHRVIHHDLTWPLCLTDQAGGENRIRAPVVFDSVSQRLLITIGGASAQDTAGNCVGTRALLLQWPNYLNQDAVNGWQPLCNSGLCPPGVPGPCVQDVGPLPVGETFCDEYGSEVATMPYGSASQAAFAWFDTRDSTLPPNPPVGPACPPPTNLQVDFWGGSVTPGTHGVNWTASRITPLGPGVPWTWSPCFGFCDHTPWGEYQGMTAANGQFFSFWADQRNTSLSQIYTASFGP